MTVMEERFELASQRILEIEKEKRMPEQFQRYFAENADYLGVLLEEYKWIASGAMREASLQELERHNESCFIDLMGRNYETSYANPDWAYAQLGETFGQLLSAVAAELRSLPAFIYEQDLEGITIVCRKLRGDKRSTGIFPDPGYFLLVCKRLCGADCRACDPPYRGLGTEICAGHHRKRRPV